MHPAYSATRLTYSALSPTVSAPLCTAPAKLLRGSGKNEEDEDEESVDASLASEATATWPAATGLITAAAAPAREPLCTAQDSSIFRFQRKPGESIGARQFVIMPRFHPAQIGGKDVERVPESILAYASCPLCTNTNGELQPLALD